MAQLCRLTSQTSDILLRQGKFERKNDNFNRASRLFSKSKSMLKRDPKGRWVDGDTMFKLGSQIGASPINQSECAHQFENTTKITRQECKLLAQKGEYYEAVKLLGLKISERLRPVYRQGSQNNDNKRFNLNEDEEAAKSMLDMVKWLEADWSNLGGKLEALYLGGDRNEFCQSLEELVKAEQDVKETTLVKYSLLGEAHQETVLGCIINLASIKSPSNSKSFKKLGSFCYKWGSKAGFQTHSLIG